MIGYRLGMVCTTLWLLQAAPAAVAQTPPPAGAVDALETLEPAPVVVWGRTIVVLRASVQGETPAERAERAVTRIEALPPRGDWEVRWGKAAFGDLSGAIVGTQSGLLLALLQEDVDTASGETLEQVAKRTVATLQDALAARAAQMQWPVLLRGLGFAGGATLVYFVFLWGLFRVREIVARWLDRMIAESPRSLSLAGVNLVPILLWIERMVAKILFLAVVLIATYLWLTFCFAQFFYTEAWAKGLGAFLVGILRDFALAIVGAVPGLFAVLVIFWLTRIVAAAAASFFTGVERGTMTVTWLHPESARASRRIVLAGIWLFAVTVAYPYIPGSGSDAFKGVSVFAGLMLSLGSSGFMNHLMSGLVIAYSGALRVGDYVTLGDVEGTVQDLGPMTTRIATQKRESVAIPNGVVVGASITNYSLLAGRDGAVVSTMVTIGYDAPWRQVHALLLLAASRTTGIRPSPAPFVLQRALSDFYVEYELRFAIDRPVERVRVLSALHAAIQDAFNEAGVQIMSPNFEAQPEQPVLVPRDQWHAAPAAPPETADAPDRPARRG